MFQFPPLPPIEAHHRQVAFAFAGVFVLIELALTLSDMGVLPPNLRGAAYLEFSFFDPFFERWLAGERAPPQVVWTPLTYAFLHGGMTHLALNTAAFLGLGLVVLRIFGAPLFVLFFAVTAIGGALAYGLLSDAEVPMVGASGVVFGLIGVLKYAEFAFITRRREGSMRAFWGSIGALVMINVILSVAMGGMLAWQTHLGGFATGWLVARRADASAARRAR
jgi:membrane associated rhomboid family serine protease